MSEGFKKSPEKSGDGENLNITVDLDNIDVILKKYKKIKKYMKSSLFAVKTMDGTEEIVSSLVKEAEENPL
jgi:hypothetical protein